MERFCDLPEGYVPLETEPFMNDRQKEYFRRKLLIWRDEIMQRSLDTLDHLKRDSIHEPDDLDQACLEEEMFEELMLRDRESKLLVKVDEALERLQQGQYGFCIETGAPIPLKRLEARLVATHCLQARIEEEEKRLSPFDLHHPNLF